MDVMEAVKDKARYREIVEYFDKMVDPGTEQTALLIDAIEQMSEEIFEHYKAMQVIFKTAVADILMRRDREALRVLLWEKYEAYDRELQ